MHAVVAGCLNSLFDDSRQGIPQRQELPALVLGEARELTAGRRQLPLARHRRRRPTLGLRRGARHVAKGPLQLGDLHVGPVLHRRHPPLRRRRRLLERVAVRAALMPAPSGV